MRKEGQHGMHLENLTKPNELCEIAIPYAPGVPVAPEILKKELLAKVMACCLLSIVNRATPAPHWVMTTGFEAVPTMLTN